MKLAILGPISHPAPLPYHSRVARLVHRFTDGLVGRGVDVTLFASMHGDREAESAIISPPHQGENSDLDINIRECLVTSRLFEQAANFDLIHNHIGYLPLIAANLVPTPMLTTLHGSPPPETLPVYRKYNDTTYYVSTSDAGRQPGLHYLATIHDGVAANQYQLRERPGDHLLFLADIKRHNGSTEAIEIARRFDMKLIIAGQIRDRAFFDAEIAPQLDDDRVEYMASVQENAYDELLAGAYAFLPAIDSDEPSEISLIEALACGTPVVARKQGVSPEIIEQGKTGFFVNSIDEAVEALKRIPEIDRAACRRIVEERFSRDRMVSEYLRVYQRILEKERARRADTQRDRRPWGEYRVLENEDTYKVKRIDILPGKRLSYQKHFKRSEHWLIVKGVAKVTLDGKDILVKAGEPIDIPVETAHRIENIGPEVLTLIEIQQGTYFGEDDIVRLRDDFGRIPSGDES